MLPAIKLGETEITRLIIGGNMISGSSHISYEKDGEFQDYYSTENVKKALRRCEECGINTAALRSDKHILRIFREYRLEGGTIQWLAQTAPEMADFSVNIRNITAYNPVAIYMNGGMTDKLYRAGKYDQLKENFKIMRATGKPVGAATHFPEFIDVAESNGFDIDFYMCCVFNVWKEYKPSPTVLARPYDEMELFDEADVPVMYSVIRKVQKPCFAFKILGASHRLKEEGAVRKCFKEAFENIKDTDGVMVGVLQKDSDQIAYNATLVNELLS